MWDSEYFIDFFFYTENETLIGIQLKPESFYLGGYGDIVNLAERLRLFEERFNAKTFVLTYRRTEENNVLFLTDNQVIESIKAVT